MVIIEVYRLKTLNQVITVITVVLCELSKFRSLRFFN